MKKWFRRGSMLMCMIFSFVVLAPHHLQAAQLERMSKASGGTFIGSLEGYLTANQMPTQRLFGVKSLKKVIDGFKNTWSSVRRNYSQIRENFSSFRKRLLSGDNVDLGLMKLREQMRNWVVENVDEMGIHDFAKAVEKTAGRKMFSKDFYKADEAIARSMFIKNFDEAMKRICDEQKKKSSDNLMSHVKEAERLVERINMGDRPDAVVHDLVDRVVTTQQKASQMRSKASDPTQFMVGLLVSLIGTILLTIAIAAVVAPIAIAVVGTIVTVIVTKLVGVVGGIGAAAIGVGLAAAAFIYFSNMFFDFGSGVAGTFLGPFFNKKFIDKKSQLLAEPVTLH